jgi:hypothetical protein
MGYNWIYTSWNDNEYILFLIIIILTFIIIDFGLWKSKVKFDNITQPITTTYQPPQLTNPNNNIFVSDAEKESWRRAWVQLDGDEETIASTSKVQNDITQLDSTLYNQSTSNDSNDSNGSNGSNGINYNVPGDYATIDNLGKSLTDTLGGVKSNFGYTLLQEQLGTFKPNYINPNTYDNTQKYTTGMNSNTVDGASTSTNGSGEKYQLIGKNGTPIIMQKDFAGVANIFAPNIYISNPPLNSDGYPDISYST